MEEESLGSKGPGLRLSIFDHSAENYFKAIDTICNLCEDPESDDHDESDIQRLSSSITFLREWRSFRYEPRIIKFANETGSCGDKDALSEINLPQFSSAVVPKKEGLCTDVSSLESSKDFVMYVGGSVWALDWCPSVYERLDCHTKCEFIAVATHPPGSYYHKIGSPLTGRGIIQVWCVLNVSVEEEEELPSNKNPKKRGPQSNDATGEKSKKPRGRPRKKPIDDSLDIEATKDKSIQSKKPRGRPRKKLTDESLDGEATKNKAQLKRPGGRCRKEPSDDSTYNLDSNGQFGLALSVQHPEDSSELQTIQEVGNSQEHTIEENLGNKQKTSTKNASASDSALKTLVQSRRLNRKTSAGRFSDDIHLPLSTPIEDGAPMVNHQFCHSSGQDSVVCDNVPGHGPLDMSLASCSIPKDIALPRVVLCLAHNGKVAWDVKWQPYNANNSKCELRMGYLAVLLGNGSVEVWEVPLPRTVKSIYLSSVKEGTDPRFMKLEPVFRCLSLNCGGMQSIPLTVEWSISFPHDYLLVGCHDGTVALWKFSATGSSKDTRPLLCFSADTVPIRAVAWAPTESDLESANVIITAGHGGLKFWDIRDPFHPLWEPHGLTSLCGLDWSSDPRCIILSSCDGEMKILSLVEAAYDVPATGKPLDKKTQGLHDSNFTSFAIWSVQVSRLTGMLAYCCADGTVIRTQLTKGIEKDYSRNCCPHFLCGFLTEDESTIVVNTPLPDSPIKLKKRVKNSGETSLRSLAMESNPAKSANAKKGKKSLNLDDRTLGEESDVPSSEAPKSRKKTKPGSSSRDQAKDDQALLCIDEDYDTMNEKGETENKFEVFPSKMVAMHRVRWNMNKGSERWLCYGGAAGIVRCQEIIAPDVHKKWRQRT